MNPNLAQRIWNAFLYDADNELGGGYGVLYLKILTPAGKQGVLDWWNDLNDAQRASVRAGLKRGARFNPPTHSRALNGGTYRVVCTAGSVV